MKPFVHVVCDYAPGDLAWAEVTAALGATLRSEATFHVTAVGSFETVATGFVIAQLALAPETMRPPSTYLFANCAPRKDRSRAREENEGEGLLYGVVRSGVPIIAVNSGCSLSFVRDDLTELWRVNVPNKGSQFRSRDFYPGIVGQLLRGDLSFRESQLDPQNVIPPRPAQVIGYVDSFGNLKTTLRDGDERLRGFEPGQRVRVVIGTIERTATVATGSFNVHEGDLALAPGSSGYDRRYWELFKRGGSASDEFGRPRAGEPFLLR